MQNYKRKKQVVFGKHQNYDCKCLNQKILGYQLRSVVWPTTWRKGRLMNSGSHPIPPYSGGLPAQRQPLETPLALLIAVFITKMGTAIV